MKLREISIKNFRNLVDVTVPIDDTTVLVGENNSGKTALLEALKLSLPRRISQVNTDVFNEYDYYMSKLEDSPKNSEGIIIELLFKEDMTDDWNDSLSQSLNDIIQTDPIEDLDSIILRLSSKFNEEIQTMVTKWEFLDLMKHPLEGKGANPNNLAKFLSYICLFYLSALRDSNDEFSTRSQFWGRILRDLKISENQDNELRKKLIELNRNLLTVDARLEQVIASLDNAQKVLGLESQQRTSIQALPFKPLELMSKSAVVIRAHGSQVDFPLLSYGQGTQSLAVFFLFQAYIDVMLKPTFEPETEAILALEEPEAHLHPQAVRSLAANLDNINSQKVVSTHSPYFIQEIPFTQIRLFRRDGSSSKILYLKRFFRIKVPREPSIMGFCQRNSSKFTYQESTSTLLVKGKIAKKEYQDLIKVYSAYKELHPKLKQIYKESQLYLSDQELADLDTYAKRIRGEVLFARAWLLCEGQSEYLLLRYFAEILGMPLDQAGVAVIDFQNNGSPGAFVGLARAFEIPWVMICDNDNAGKDFKDQVKKRGITESECVDFVHLLPEDGTVLEMFLIKNGFEQEYLAMLEERNLSLTKIKGEPGFYEEIESKLKEDKTGYVIGLIKKLRELNADSTRVPELFATVIRKIVGKVN